jgi:hypothetical protein
LEHDRKDREDSVGRLTAEDAEKTK